MLDSRLRHVVALARSGSFTAAAAHIGVTQSAVTKSVSDVERQIGYQLFHRTARGALLTEEGRDFVERAARVLEEAGELLNRNRPIGNPYAGILHLGVCPASLEWMLSKPLADFLLEYGHTRVEVSSSSFERMVQLVRNGTVDVALGFDGAFGQCSDLKRVPYLPLETVLFVRKNHPALTRENWTLSELAIYDFIAPADSQPYGEMFRNTYEGTTQWRKRLHIVDYFPTVRQIVASSDAVGVVSHQHTCSAAFQTRFAILPCTDSPPTALTCCAYRAPWEPKPVVRAFVSFLQRHNDQH